MILIRNIENNYFSPFLVIVHELSVECAEEYVDDEKKAELSTDELVQGSLKVNLFPSVIFHVHTFAHFLFQNICKSQTQRALPVLLFKASVDKHCSQRI